MDKNEKIIRDRKIIRNLKIITFLDLTNIPTDIPEFRMHILARGLYAEIKDTIFDTAQAWINDYLSQNGEEPINEESLPHMFDDPHGLLINKGYIELADAVNSNPVDYATIEEYDTRIKEGITRLSLLKTNRTLRDEYGKIMQVDEYSTIVEQISQITKEIDSISTTCDAKQLTELNTKMDEAKQAFNKVETYNSKLVTQIWYNQKRLDELDYKY